MQSQLQVAAISERAELGGVGETEKIGILFLLRVIIRRGIIRRRFFILILKLIYVQEDDWIADDREERH